VAQASDKIVCYILKDILSRDFVAIANEAISRYRMLGLFKTMLAGLAGETYI
jgi:hypothetical protein